MPQTGDFIRAKLEGLKTTLQSAPTSEKKNVISKPMADEFNGILSQAAQEYPVLKDQLPKAIPTRRIGSMAIGQATFLELEAFCEQTLNLLRLVR